MSVKLKTVVLNGTPKSWNGLSRMGGLRSVVTGIGYGCRRGQPSKSSVQNEGIGCPKCPKWESQNENRKFRIQLQRSDILIAGIGCPEWRVALRRNRDRKTVATAGNSPRLMSRMRLLAVQNVQNGKVRMKTGNSEFSSSGATY
jgi:hypothetical protein